MGWPFSRREYHKKWYIHSHTVNNWVDKNIGEPAAAALPYTPIGIVYDIATGNAANNPVVANVVGGGGGGDDDPPPDNRPTCNSLKLTNPTATQLRDFNTAPDCQTPGTPTTLNSWLLTKRSQFCLNVDNFGENPGGGLGLCAERNAGTAIAEQYCALVDDDGEPNIKKLWCTREDLGPDVYARLAGAYCQTDTGKAHQWCTCYNVKNGVCDTDPNAAGCADKALTFDTLVANTPEFFKPQWLGREGCFGACAESAGESKYLPVDETNVCASDINICGGIINADNMTKSAINSTCTIGGNTFDPLTGQLQDPDGNPVDNPNKDKDSTNFFTKYFPTSLANFFTKYFPTSLADLTGDDTNKKIGAGASVSFSLLCCICLIIVIVMLSPGGGSSRFRR